MTLINMQCCSFSFSILESLLELPDSPLRMVKEVCKDNISDILRQLNCEAFSELTKEGKILNEISTTLHIDKTYCCCPKCPVLEKWA